MRVGTITFSTRPSPASCLDCRGCKHKHPRIASIPNVSPPQAGEGTHVCIYSLGTSTVGSCGAGRQYKSSYRHMHW